MSEVWFRNPNNYVRELVETGEKNIAWDRGQLVRTKIDPIKFSDAYFGAGQKWRSLAIGTQGTAEYRTGNDWYKPHAVYPTWQYGEDFGVLAELLEYPVGANPQACNDMTIPGDERPVFGQEHRVVIVGIPPSQSGPGRAFISELMSMVEDFPSAIVHLHAQYSYRVMFGLGFQSADVDPRTDAQKGNIILPNGRRASPEVASAHHMAEIRRMGFKPVDLKEGRNRCIFNIRSARDASENWERPAIRRRAASAGDAPIDHYSPDSQYQPVESTRQILPKAQPGDKLTCDTCSLFDNCDYAREGAVCTLPNAVPKSLASHFKTRDSHVILEGLSNLLVKNTERLERAMAVEERIGDVDGDVTKMIGQVFDHGVKYAKLVDPSLAKPTVQVNIGPGGHAQVGAAPNPKALVAGFIRELEAQGIPRDAITPEMIEAMAKRQMQPPPPEDIGEMKIIEAEVTNG